MLNVTIWNEYVHEPEEPSVAEIYPGGCPVVSPRCCKS